MSTSPQDTEITLGTGRMLAIFFIFVLVCAFFFAIGFSLGRKTTTAVAGLSLNAPAGTSASAARPSPAKSEASKPAEEMTFYKAVGEKNADTVLTPQDSKAPSAAPNAAAPNAEPAKTASEAASAPPASGGYYVQVAAVSRQEDAEALVEALKKKQYPAFIANNPVTDKFYHVQVGPYAEVKDADAMRARLIGDGYNPIVKK
jgi:cell division septation protein DedD